MDTPFKLDIGWEGEGRFVCALKNHLLPHRVGSTPFHPPLVRARRFHQTKYERAHVPSRKKKIKHIEKGNALCVNACIQHTATHSPVTVNNVFGGPWKAVLNIITPSLRVA